SVKARPGRRQLQTAEEAQPGGGVLEEEHPRGVALAEQGRVLGPEQGASLDFGQRDGFTRAVSQAEVLGDGGGGMGGSLQGPAGQALVGEVAEVAQALLEQGPRVLASQRTRLLEQLLEHSRTSVDMDGKKRRFDYGTITYVAQNTRSWPDLPG